MADHQSTTPDVNTPDGNITDGNDSGVSNKELKKQRRRTPSPDPRVRRPPG